MSNKDAMDMQKKKKIENEMTENGMLEYLIIENGLVIKKKPET